MDTDIINMQCFTCGTTCPRPNKIKNASKYITEHIDTITKVNVSVSSKLAYSDTVYKLLNTDSFDIKFNDDDVICECCSILMEEMHKFQCESKRIEDMLIQQISRNYNLTDITPTNIEYLDDASRKTFTVDKYMVYTCLQCNKFTTMHQDRLKPHYECHELRQSFPKSDEKCEFQNVDTLETINDVVFQHLEETEEIQDLKELDEVYENDSIDELLDEKIVVYEKRTNVYCNICHLRLNTLKEMMDHKEKFHSGSTYVCRLCNYVSYNFIYCLTH